MKDKCPTFSSDLYTAADKPLSPTKGRPLSRDTYADY